VRSLRPTMPRPLRILGSAIELPARRVDNEELVRELAEHGLVAPPAAIAEKAGVRTRYRADVTAGETAVEMGARAARRALAEAAMDPAELDLILWASGSPHQAIPDGACLLQRELGLGASGIPCMAVGVTCMSFLAALDVASAMMPAGRKRVLVVSSDISSIAVDWAHFGTAALLGDGACAFVVGEHPESHIHPVQLRTYGEFADAAEIRSGGSARHPFADHTTREDQLFHMNGKQLLRCVLQHAPAFIESSLRGFGVDPASIDVVVSHQASRAGLQFIETQFERQGFTRARHVTTLDRYGNCVAASLPMTLHHALTEGGPSADGQPRPLPRGSNVLLLGAGAGVSLGVGLLRY